MEESGAAFPVTASYAKYRFCVAATVADGGKEEVEYGRGGGGIILMGGGSMVFVTFLCPYFFCRLGSESEV